MISTRHERYFSILEKIAKDVVSPVTAPRLASCLVIGSTIISFGVNKKQTHPLQARFGRNTDSIILHSEIAAINNALRAGHKADLSKASLYILRVKYDSSVIKTRNVVRALSSPCIGCQKAIQYFKIKKTIYTVDKDNYAILELH